MIFSRFALITGSAFGRSQLFGFNEGQDNDRIINLNAGGWIIGDSMRLSYEACPEDSLVGSESCIAAKERELTDCIFYCYLDTTCISECNRDHINQIEKCPCYDDCYNGCPCEYESDYCDSGMCSFYQSRVFKQPSALSPHWFNLKDSFRIDFR